MKFPFHSLPFAIVILFLVSDLDCFSDSGSGPLFARGQSVEPVVGYFKYDQYLSKLNDGADPNTWLQFNLTLVALWVQGTSPTAADSRWMPFTSIDGQCALSNTNTSDVTRPSTGGALVPCYASDAYPNLFLPSQFTPYADGGALLPDGNSFTVIIPRFPSLYFGLYRVNNPVPDLTGYRVESLDVRYPSAGFNRRLYLAAGNSSAAAPTVTTLRLTRPNYAAFFAFNITGLDVFPATGFLNFNTSIPCTASFNLQLQFLYGASLTDPAAVYSLGGGSMSVTNGVRAVFFTAARWGVSVGLNDNLVRPYANVTSSIPNIISFRGLAFYLNGTRDVLTFQYQVTARRYGIFASGATGSILQQPNSALTPLDIRVTPIAASAVGDPQFNGLLGQQFQVHGIDGGVYSIISQNDLQINAKFVFLSQGECPTYHDGTKGKNCWSHSGSYFGSLGLRTSAGDRVVVTAGSAVRGFLSIEINGKLFQSVSDSGNWNWTGADLVLTVRDSHHLNIATSSNLWSIDIENSDSFINLERVQVNDWQRLVRAVRPSGLLGQTWRRRKSSMTMTAAEIDDYLDENNDILGCDNQHNKFSACAAPVPVQDKHKN